MKVLLSKKILSVFVACTIFSPIFPSQASEPNQPTTITLDQAVHFTGTDGSDVVAEPGEYSVEAAQEWLRLIPGTKRQDALLIETQPGIHDTKVEIPIVSSTAGTEPNQTDVFVVQMLNSDGTSLVATGTYSDIPSQAFGAAAKASDSHDALTVTIDRTAQFPNPEGEDVLVPAGTYAVTVEAEQFTLTEGTGTPITIRAMEGSHPNEMPIPYMVFYSSKEGEIPQRHLLALFYPDGKNLQAIGGDPIVTSRGSEGLPSEYVIDPALLTFEQSVHFTAPDGTPVVVQPGTYTAKAAEKSIRLISNGDSQEALLIEARQGTHETPLDVLLALSLPGTTPKELDLNYLMLLLPTGESLEAIGSYSGIQTRGLLSGAFNKAKQGISSGASAVGSGASAVGKAAGKVVIGGAKGVGSVAVGGANLVIEGGKVIGSGVVQVGKGLEWTAKTSWEGMKWAYDRLDDVAKLAFCYGFFESTEALKVGGKAIKFVSTLAEKIAPNVLKDHANIVGKLTNNVPFKNQFSQYIGRVKDQLPEIPELDRTRDWLRNPANITKVRALFTPKNICHGFNVNTSQLGLPLKNAPFQPQVLPQIKVAMVPGTYRQNPVQNDWHIGSIIPDGAGLRWTNKAGASWRLTPDLANQRLLTGPDNPYYAQGLREFKLVISNGQITGFEFGGGTYQRSSAQAQVQAQVQAPAQPQLTVVMVPGGYRHNPVQNNWHIGSIVPDGVGLRWTNKAGASWRLTPDLANQRLLTGPDNPYYAQGLREFKLVISNGQIAGFTFAGGTYLRESTLTQSQSLIRSRSASQGACKKKDWLLFELGFDVPFPSEALKSVGKVTKFFQLKLGTFAAFPLGQDVTNKNDCFDNPGAWWFVGFGVGNIESISGAISAAACKAHTKDDFGGWGLGVQASAAPNPEMPGLTLTQKSLEFQFPREFYKYNSKDLPWCFTIPIVLSPSMNEGPRSETLEASLNYEFVFGF